MEQPEGRKKDVFVEIEWYAAKLAGTLIFVAFVCGEVAHVILRMLAK